MATQSRNSLATVYDAFLSKYSSYLFLLNKLSFSFATSNDILSTKNLSLH